MTIHQVLERQKKHRYRLILAYLILALPWIINGAMSALEPTPNSPLDWVDAEFGPRHDYDRFVSHFASGDIVVISWPGCGVSDSRLDDVTHSLRRSQSFFQDESWLFHRVFSGREILQSLLSPPMSLAPAEAKNRLSSSLLGSDGETTAIVVEFSKEGLRQRARLVPLIQRAVFQHAGVAYEMQHLAGPIVDGYQVDLASQATMSRFAPLSSMIVLCVCLLCLDSIYGAFLLFGVSCFCQAFALAVLHYGGGTMTALLLVLPPLVQVLAVAGGIHLLNYYFDNSQLSPEEATLAAVRTGWLPCVLSSATTAMGLGSLAVSGLAAVREFGIFAALGVLSTLGSLLVLLPGILHWKPISFPESEVRKPSGNWIRLFKVQQRYSSAIALGGVLSIVIMGLGLTKLEASVRIETLFSDSSRLIRDYAWIEEHVGPRVPIEVVIQFSSAKKLSATERLELLKRAERIMQAQAEVRSVTSCLDFMPPPPFPLEGRFAEQYLRSVLEPVREAGYAQSAEGYVRWRLTAHLSALGNYDYGQILANLRAALEAETVQARNSKALEIELSGLMPLVHEIQRQLLQDLFSSFLTAFALIAVVMTIVQAGMLSGLIAMIPNVFPSITLFGMLGWMEYPIDIGSIMTASVAMGIAVDDTLHFLNFYRRRIEAGDSRETAVLAAYQRCGRAMIQTTLICGAGLAIFALSDFVPTARFAWMMVALLLAALIGDLVLLPALLLSSVNRFFEYPRQSHE